MYYNTESVFKWIQIQKMYLDTVYVPSQIHFMFVAKFILCMYVSKYKKCIQIQKIFVRKQGKERNETPSFFLRSISYLVVFSSEHLYSHDGKNEPENEADQKDVEDTGNGLHESIYNDLGQKRGRKNRDFSFLSPAQPSRIWANMQQ